LNTAINLVPSPTVGMLDDRDPKLDNILGILVDVLEIFPQIRKIKSPTKYDYNVEYPTFNDFLKGCQNGDDACVQTVESYLSEFIIVLNEIKEM
jgi:hypothetical protein